jgi:hypothetical protein
VATELRKLAETFPRRDAAEATNEWRCHLVAFRLVISGFVVLIYHGTPPVLCRLSCRSSRSLLPPLQVVEVAVEPKQGALDVLGANVLAEPVRALMHIGEIGGVARWPVASP